MLYLSKEQKKHVSEVVYAKRKELFGYRGGNRDLARRVGVSPQLISMWASNKRSPNHRELMILAEVFNITLNELCRLNMRNKNSRRRRDVEYPVSYDDARQSMIDICTIANQLATRQQQMLTGKRNIKKHSQWLSRIKHYVDTI